MATKKTKTNGASSVARSSSRRREPVTNTPSVTAESALTAAPPELAPVELAPPELAPVELAPVELTPVELAPVEPAPVEPAALPLTHTVPTVDAPPAPLPSVEQIRARAYARFLAGNRDTVANWFAAENELRAGIA